MKMGLKDAFEMPMMKNKVGKVMHEFKMGTLKSGGKKKVRNKKQAIAIGLAEARRLKGMR